jgi:hypothetical protein
MSHRATFDISSAKKTMAASATLAALLTIGASSMSAAATFVYVTFLA